MTWHLTLEEDSYEAARESFEWDAPEGYNAAHDLVRKHDDPGAVALHQAHPDGRRETYTFRDLDRRSNRLANALEALGVSRGDRVGVVLPPFNSEGVPPFTAGGNRVRSFPQPALYSRPTPEHL